MNCQIAAQQLRFCRRATCSHLRLFSSHVSSASSSSAIGMRQGLLPQHRSTAALVWTTVGNNNVFQQTRGMSMTPRFKESEVLYEGPMSKLISSLKIFSLSSAVLSSVGLPLFMVSRGIDTFTSVHFAMYFSTCFGSLGSTFGLQYIFGPYVHKLERIPVRQCSHRTELAESIAGDDEKPQKQQPTIETSTSDGAEPDFMLKATTRSIVMTRIEHVFNPDTDVDRTPAGVLRPFCSFFVNGKALYIHEEMINDPKLNYSLFRDKPKFIPQPKSPDPDDDFF